MQLGLTIGSQWDVPHPPFMGRAEPFTVLRAYCKYRLRGRYKPDVLRPGIVGMRGSIGI